MTETMPASRSEVRGADDGTDARGARFLSAVAESVAKAVVGADVPLRLMATALLAEGHVLLEDVPGVGKTLLARAFAQSIGLTFARVQGTPDLLPADVTGSSILDGADFRFVPGPIFANVLLVDEINRATPRTQSAMLEAMQERQVTAEGTTRPLPDPFLVLATQNPIELEGTFALPEAQLDRFLLRIAVGYPDEAAERRIAGRYRASAEPLEAVGKVADPAELATLRQAARQVAIEEDVERYLVALVRGTREHPDVRLGASPRSSVALYRASQAWALLAGRDFVLPDDVRGIAHNVLDHRLLLDVDRELRGATVAGVVDAVLAEVPVPMPDDETAEDEATAESSTR